MPDKENKDSAISFGPFRLLPRSRLLEKDGAPLPIGGRALDILVVLAQHAGEVVDKRELVKHVWADVNVDEGSLRFHITALRKALSERLQAGDVVLLDELKLESPKTKDFVRLLSALEIKGTALIVAQGGDKNLTLASRNVPNVALATGDSLSTYDVLRPNKLVFTRGAFEQVEARLVKKEA